MTFVDIKTPPPLRCAVAQIFAHITGASEEAPVLRKPMRLTVRTGQSGRVAAPESHPNPLQSTLLYTHVYSETSVTDGAILREGHVLLCFAILVI